MNQEPRLRLPHSGHSITREKILAGLKANV